MNVEPALIDAIARCLAKQDGPFISAREWVDDKAYVYTERAIQVLVTIHNYEAGRRSGGLPLRQWGLREASPAEVEVISVDQPVSVHFTKAQAETARSRYAVSPPLGLTCHCHMFEIRPTHRRFRRWEVRAVYVKPQTTT